MITIGIDLITDRLGMITVGLIVISQDYWRFSRITVWLLVITVRFLEITVGIDLITEMLGMVIVGLVVVSVD